MSDIFEALDFIYSPSRDAAAEAAYFEKQLGARVVFAIEGMGTRVAMIELSQAGPRLLLAEHLEGERAVLVYRVASLTQATASLRRRGWKRGDRVELPMGTACSFATPGGHRIAIYEATRPGVIRGFEGRRDF